VDCILVGALNPDGAKNVNKDAAIFAPQTDFFYWKNITFINYGNTAAIATCNDCQAGSEFKHGGVTYRSENVRFVNTSRRVRWNPHYREIIRDLDGSFANRGSDTYVVKNFKFNRWPGVCFDLDSAAFDNALVCNTPVRRVVFENPFPSQLDWTDLRISTPYGSDEIYFLPMEEYGWSAPLVVDKDYTISFTDAGISFTKLSITFGVQAFLKEARALGRNESLRIKYTPYRYDYNGFSYALTYNGNKVTSNTSVDLPEWPYLNFANSYVNKTLKLDFNNFGADLSQPLRVSIEAQQCPPDGCYVPPPPAISSNFMLWSNASAWPDQRLPQVIC
jgi:hypothetical protein